MHAPCLFRLAGKDARDVSRVGSGVPEEMSAVFRFETIIRYRNQK